GGRLRFPLPGTPGRASVDLADVDRAAQPLLARPARNPGPDRLPPADHPSRDRADPRRGGVLQHHQDDGRARMDPRGRPPGCPGQAGVVRHHPRLPRLLQPEIAGPAAATVRNPRHGRPADALAASPEADEPGSDTSPAIDHPIATADEAANPAADVEADDASQDTEEY